MDLETGKRQLKKIILG